MQIRSLMRTKTTELILALCFFGAVMCFADDPQVGTLETGRIQIKADRWDRED